MMKRLALLLPLLLLLTACHTPAPIPQVPGQPDLEAVSNLDGEGYTLDSPALEDVQGDTALTLCQTLGNGTELSLLYGVRLPESLGETLKDKVLQGLLALPVVLEPEAESLSIQILQYDPESRILYFLAGAAFSEKGYEGETLTLTISDTALLDLPETALSVTWTP